MFQPLLKTIHLLFHDPHFDVECLVQFHEPVYMSGQPINTILHRSESLIHFFSEITKLKMNATEFCIYLLKSRIYLLKSRIYLLKSRIYLLKSRIYLLKSRIYLLKSRIYLLESRIYLPESSANNAFQRRELLIDCSRFLCRALLSHIVLSSCPSGVRKSSLILRSTNWLLKLGPVLYRAAPGLLHKDLRCYN